MGNEIPEDRGNQVKRDGGELTLSGLVHSIRKHFVAALVAFAVIFVGVFVWTLMLPPKFTSTAKLFATYSESSGSTENYSAINSASSYINNQIQSYPTLAKTSAVLQPAVNHLGNGMTVGELSSHISVSNPSNTAFINVTANDVNPQMSADMANAVAQSLQSMIQDSLYPGKDQSPVKITIVQDATAAHSPSSPRYKLNIAIGFVGGIVCGIIVALLRDVLTTKIQDSKDLADYIDAPVLGRIPQSDLLLDAKPVVISASGSAIAEEYRRIGAMLSFTSPASDTNARLIIISSVGANEGKTTTATNLATALAENGSTVLLIDADLRHPSVAKAISIEGSMGLTHVLSGQATVKDVVQKYWKPNLHVLPAGPKPPNAAALLNSELMTELIERALKTYDYVLIDTAPMIVANEAAIFAKLGGGFVLVTRRGYTNKNELRNTANELNALGVSLTGYVFNYAKENKQALAGSNYYYYNDQPSRSVSSKNRHTK